MELREVLAVLRAGWWVPLVCLLLGAAAGAGVSLATTPLYTSSTQLFVSISGSSSASEILQGNEFSEDRVLSYAELLAGELLAGRVVEELDLPVSPGTLGSQVSAQAVPDTVLLDVSVTDASPELAQRIAETIGQEFPDLVSELESTDAAGRSPVKVTVVQPAGLPESPSTPQTERNVALGALAGLVVGVGVVISRAALDRSLTSPAGAAEAAGAPVIGEILRDPAMAKDTKHTVDRRGDDRTAEGYRQLRNNLQFLNVDKPPRVIMVTSAVAAEGKTTAVVNLALALVDAGRTVAIVEADLRRPRVTGYLGLVGGAGLTNVLAGTAGLEDVLQPYEDGGLSVLAAGPTPPNPGELLSSSHMADLLEKLRGQYDYVLVDAPPLLPVADAGGLAVLVDGALISVRYGRTTADQLRQAAAVLARVGATSLGLILNIVPPKAELGTAYGYGYYREGKHTAPDLRQP